MRLVVADTGPIHYLILIGYIEILHKLFEKIYLPTIVRNEMTHPRAPQVVRVWTSSTPSWVEALPEPVIGLNDTSLMDLDEGERSAIVLAGSLKADLILMDDREGTTVARQKGFAVIGTLGILDLAAQRGMVDLQEAFSRLKATNFRYPQQITDGLLALYAKRLDTNR